MVHFDGKVQHGLLHAKCLSCEPLQVTRPPPLSPPLSPCLLVSVCFASRVSVRGITEILCGKDPGVNGLGDGPGGTWWEATPVLAET